ncbi:MAG: SdiA-regulated/phytase-like domain-containing protein [Planctomycetota bacterium]|jgi:hypothetical protein
MKKGIVIRLSCNSGIIVFALSAIFLVTGCAEERAEKEPPPRDRPATQPADWPAEVEMLKYGQGRVLATLADRQIKESSGLACSRRLEGVFWTHNDSSGEPRIFAFNLNGDALATYRVSGARAVDWEDMASFTLNGKHFLLLADVGDNRQQRESATLYIVPEPHINPHNRGATGSVNTAMTIRLTYPDGPHNCEAVAVDPTTRSIYLLTKRDGQKLYRLPIPESGPEVFMAAEKIGELNITQPTAMDICPDGRRAVVLTYWYACEYARRRSETWAEAFARGGRGLTIPAREQGEAICYGHDGKTLYLTSEALPTPLIELPVVEGQ